MMRITIALFLVFVLNKATAQQNLPTDYLSKEFHKGRRDAFRGAMPPNSVAVIFSYPERVFSLDINYVYHPNPDLYYLSGYKEPDAVLLIFKENQKKDDTDYNELFFVRKRNPAREVWTGRRLGVEGVKTELGFKMVYNGEDFEKFPVPFSKMDHVLFDVIPDNIGSGNLLELMNSFKKKSRIKPSVNKYLREAYTLITYYTTAKNLTLRIKHLKNIMEESNDTNIRSNPVLLELINNPDSNTLASVKQKIRDNPLPEENYDRIISGLEK